ncbi:hypothetical protein CH296_18895 [Rhodococcus sp. 14-2496-1d]|uniref:helix-turn-helix domain-containing protein n=1 Tax=Rhodococcus sp. 14-2496-1d TaxID=2023146 RepID=UPI000B9C3C5F|nr:helix-turn-helix transcriptional regulator [Rhodococcus sp. 14-2496-1d]OZF28478.1 hypothetical protein CH296_18895 [Rhodococcus sp. 14-2496-1d]
MSTQMSDMGWVPEADTFGARLALVRHRMKWNAKEAALACGVPQGSWREWELRERLPRDFAGAASKIAATTGCDEYWLITGRQSPRPDGDPNGGLTVRHQGFEPRTR